MTTNPTDTAEARADRVNGHCMQASLGTLLDQVPGARAVVPHLAALERALGAQGARAIESISPAGLKRICAQLNSLPLPAGDAPLQELQARLNQASGVSAAAVSAPDSATAVRPLLPERPADRPVTAMPFVDSRLLSVDEASMTDFDNAMALQPEPDPFASRLTSA